MSYTVIITPEAASQMNAMPPHLVQFIRQRLAHLAGSTSSVSKPTTLLQPGGQLFEVKYDTDGAVVWVSIIFRFGPDEQTLHVEHVSAEFG